MKKNVLLVGPSFAALNDIACYVFNVFSAASESSLVKCYFFEDNFNIKSSSAENYSKRILKSVEKLLVDFKQTALENKIEVVHFNITSQAGDVARTLLLSKIAKDLGIKVITHFHCVIEEFYDEDSLAQQNNFKKLMALSDLVIVIDNWSGQLLDDDYNVRWKFLPNFSSEDDSYSDDQTAIVGIIKGNFGNKSTKELRKQLNEAILDIIELSEEGDDNELEGVENPTVIKINEIDEDGFLSADSFYLNSVSLQELFVTYKSV